MQAEPSTVGVSFISASKTKQPSKRDQGFWCCWGTIPSVSVAKRVMQTVLCWQTCTLEEHRRPLGLLASKPASQPGKDENKKKNRTYKPKKEKKKKIATIRLGTRSRDSTATFRSSSAFFRFFFFHVVATNRAGEGIIRRGLEC